MQGELLRPCAVIANAPVRFQRRNEEELFVKRLCSKSRQIFVSRSVGGSNVRLAAVTLFWHFCGFSLFYVFWFEDSKTHLVDGSTFAIFVNSPRAYIEWVTWTPFMGTPHPRPCHAEVLIEDGACDTWALSHRIKRALLSLPSKFTFIPLITLQFAPVVTSPVGRSGHTGGQDVASAFCHWPFATFWYGASSPFTGFLKVTISSYFQGKWKSNLFCFDVKCKSCHGYDLLLCTLSYSMQK